DRQSQAQRGPARRTPYPDAGPPHGRSGTKAPACDNCGRNCSKEATPIQETPVGSNYRPVPNRATGGAQPPPVLDRNFELKSQIHRKLLGVLNLDRVSSIPKDRVRLEIGRVVERLLEEERVPMTTAEQTKIVEEVLDEVLGLGPLEPLLKE